MVSITPIKNYPMEKLNITGTKTLYCKEVHRFLKVYNQTLIIPVANALLFFAIFKLALGDRVKTIGALPFDEFMAAGLIMMAVIQNSFANTSSSLIMGKVIGNIIDYLMPPLSAAEVTLAMIFAGVTRGVIVGVLVAAAIAVFVPIKIHSLGFIVFYLIAGSMFLATLGVFAGIISDTFDQMAAVNSYIIVPMSFLSGTFYSVNALPEFWYNVSHLNPFFYMIDGLRYGLTGYHDSNLMGGIIFLIITNIVLWLVVHTLFARGYRIKS